MSKITKTQDKDYYHADFKKTFERKENGKIHRGTITMIGEFETSDIREIIGWLDNAIN